MKNKLVYIIITCLIISILLIFLLPLLGFEMNWQVYVIILLFSIILMFGIFIIKLFIKQKPVIAVSIITLTLCIFFWFLGMSSIFFSLPFGGVANVDKVRVVDSTWNSVVIDYTKYNHDDYKEITIKKPFFVKVNSGDTIEVRYPTDHPEKMTYILGIDWGLNLISICLFTFIFVLIGGLIVVVIRVIKSPRGRRN